MYRKYPKGEITLWCDGRTDEEDAANTSKKKSKKMDRPEGQKKSHDIFQQLKEN